MVNLSHGFSLASDFPYLSCWKVTLEEADDFWHWLPRAHYLQVKPGGSGRSPGRFFKELINNGQLHLVEITAARTVWFLGGDRRWFFVRRFKQQNERLFCVLCFDNKPRKDRHAQSRCCLGLGKEGSVISQWSAVIIRCCFELKYHSLVYRQTLPSCNIMTHSYFSSSVWQLSLYQSVQIKFKEKTTS